MRTTTVEILLVVPSPGLQVQLPCRLNWFPDQFKQSNPLTGFCRTAKDPIDENSVSFWDLDPRKETTFPSLMRNTQLWLLWTRTGDQWWAAFSTVDNISYFLITQLIFFLDQSRSAQNTPTWTSRNHLHLLYKKNLKFGTFTSKQRGFRTVRCDLQVKLFRAPVFPPVFDSVVHLSIVCL